MEQKKLNFQQLFHISICAFGLQFANSLQVADTSILYKLLGAENRYLSYLWLAAPISGLFIQPIVGQFSDSTVTSYGKRIPYILFWGFAGSLSLILLPFSTSICFASILFWVLSCSHNGCTEALRALIGDITPNQQKAKAFSLQTIFAGTGAMIAALLPILLTKMFPLYLNQPETNTIPKTIQISFFAAGFVILFCTMWTSYTIKERKFTKKNLLQKEKAQLKKSNWKKIYLNLKEVYQHITNMPKIMRQLSIVQIFSWFGIFTFWLYFSIAIAQNIFGLSFTIDISTDNLSAKILEKATIWTGVCFAIYQGVSVIYAIILPKLSEKYSPKVIHGVSLFIGGISLISCYFAHNPNNLILNMIGIGIMWGSIMTMPYTIIASQVSKAKMGVYMGVFNITITLPQIISGLFLSFITAKLFHQQAMSSIILGGVFILISAVALLYQENCLDIQTKLELFIKKWKPIYQ